MKTQPLDTTKVLIIKIALKSSFLICLILTIVSINVAAFDSEVSVLSQQGLSVIPYPQEVEVQGDDFQFQSGVTIVTDPSVTEKDRFAAEELVNRLREEWNIDAAAGTSPGPASIRLTREQAPDGIGDQGYHLVASSNTVTIEAKGEAGLFYGIQTLLQLIKEGTSGPIIPGLEITDWPDIDERAVHYDTKHHQDKKSYVKQFIRDLAHYKVNTLIWEWEDKFLYPSHPKISAPGAFTKEEIQEFTRYARQYHIQLVPLVQGLGHVSYIHKWTEFKDLREIEASNWQFCPLKEGTYDLMFDLWEDAIEATPGSKYIHIGSDETYELGKGVECGCHQMAEEIGLSGLRHIFLRKAAQHLRSKGREVMIWERSMEWKKERPGRTPIDGDAKAVHDVTLFEDYEYTDPTYEFVKQAKDLGYNVWAFDPNPGIQPVFLPLYYFRKQADIGSLEHSYNFLTDAVETGLFDGTLRTSWDDSGLHNQFWMMHFVMLAEYSWSGSNPGLEEFRKTYVNNYYGTASSGVKELFALLSEGGYYYWDSLERKVWHWGEIGKTHLPDLPRGDAIEFDPYWNQEYEQMIERSGFMHQKMKRALEIIDANLNAPVKHKYDFELYRSIANLINHTSKLYLDLSELENAIQRANRQRFMDHQLALNALQQGGEIVSNILNRRETMFTNLVETWEETRLPKGYSTEEKKYQHRQDRARHFANRTADMSYLIYDEQLLGLDEYGKELRDYIEWYKETYAEFLE